MGPSTDPEAPAQEYGAPEAPEALEDLRTPKFPEPALAPSTDLELADEIFGGEAESVDAIVPDTRAPTPTTDPVDPIVPAPNPGYGVPAPPTPAPIAIRSNVGDEVEEEEIAEALDPVEESRRRRRKLVLERVRALRARNNHAG